MGKLKDSVTNWSTSRDWNEDRMDVVGQNGNDGLHYPQAKIQSTGNNDSVEDAVIAVMNIKTVDGKLLDFDTQIKALWEALERPFVIGDKYE